MFRINLLPKEVLERRRYESWYRWVIIAAVGLILIMVAVYALLVVEVSLKNGDLQSVEEQAKNTTVQAEQLSIFQNKEQELLKRQAVAQTALAGRVNIGQVANDVSLVLPDEVWLDLLTINENTGVTLSANTPRSAGESADVAYKSVAKTLVRLNELPELFDVWLSTASNATWSQWATVSTTGGNTTVQVVTFQATGKIHKPSGSPASDASAPAGSTGGTHTVAPANAAQGAVNAANGANPAATQ